MDDPKPYGWITEHRAGVEKLRTFFRDNPAEELTAEDAAQKLGVGLRTAATYLGHLSGKGGDLERVSIYRQRKQ